MKIQETYETRKMQSKWWYVIDTYYVTMSSPSLSENVTPSHPTVALKSGHDVVLVLLLQTSRTPCRKTASSASTYPTAVLPTGTGAGRRSIIFLMCQNQTQAQGSLNVCHYISLLCVLCGPRPGRTPCYPPPFYQVSTAVVTCA